MDLPDTPHSEVAERTVIGAYIADPLGHDGWSASVRKLTGSLEPGHFFSQRRRKLFAEITRRIDGNMPLDAREILTTMGADDPGIYREVAECLDRGGYFVACDANYWIERLQEEAARRGIFRAAKSMLNGIEESEDVASLSATAQEAAGEIAKIGAGSDYASAKQVTFEVFGRLEELQEMRAAGNLNADGILGVPTGFIDIDKVTSGWGPGQLIVIAGRPSMGKSAMVAQCAVNAAKAEKSSLIITLEMDRSEMVQRILASESGVPLSKIRVGDMGDDGAWDEIAIASAAISRMPIYFADRGNLSYPKIQNLVERIVAERDIDLVILDYLQILDHGRPIKERVQQVAYLTRSLKSLAREMRIPIILLSQLSRAVEQRNNKRPVLSDLRDSGTIEQDADLVAFLYREEYYNPACQEQDRNVMEFNIAKQRQGETKTVYLRFWPNRMKFGSMSQERDCEHHDFHDRY